jgi:hypothetical protein
MPGFWGAIFLLGVGYFFGWIEGQAELRKDHDAEREED